MAKFEQTFRIRNGFIGIRRADLELFPPARFAKLGITAFPSAWDPLRRLNYLRCGILRPTAALPPTNGPRIRRM